MKATKHHATVIATCLTLLLFTTGVVAVAKESTDDGKDRALFVGVSEYANLENPHVPGAVADISMMHQILVSRFDFHEENISTLLDRQATRQGIMTELNLLVEQSGPNDRIVILFSGIGSRIPMRDEEDSFARTILSSDARSPRVPDISLGELHDIVSQFKTPHVTVILDASWYNRGAPKGGLHIRAVAPDKNTHLYKRRASEKENAGTSPHPYVLLTATSQSQPALDGMIDGQRHGIFSYALGQVLAKADTNISAEGLLEPLRGEMVRIQSQLSIPIMPEPRVEGPEGRLAQPLLLSETERGGAASARKNRLAWVGVGAARDNGDIVLVKGPALGALPNSSWAIYPPNEGEFAPGAAQAVALVTGLDGLDAIAKVITPQAKIAAGSRAVLLTLPPINNDVTVRLANMDPDQQKTVEAIMRKDFPDAKIVTGAGSARFLAEQYNGKLYLKAADGVQTLASFDASPPAKNFESLPTLAQVLSHSKNARDLVALRNPFSLLNVKVRIPASLPASIKRTHPKELTLISSDQLNADDKEKRALDLTVVVYPLGTEAEVQAFRAASYDALWEKRQQGLGKGKPVITKVLPNDTKLLTIDPAPDAIALGVAGFFRTPDGDSWRDTIRMSSFSKNPDEHTEIRLSDRSLRVVQGDSHTATRGIKSVAAKRVDLARPRFRIRGDNDQRSAENSLQLEVKVNVGSFVTIVDVDPIGKINLLFPADCHDDNFNKDGFIKGGEWVRFPDSIQSPNKSKCYLDFTEPPGTDTVLVLAAPSLETARDVREWLKGNSLTVRESQDQEKIKPGQPANTSLVLLRDEMKTRGIKAVAERVSTASRKDPTDTKAVVRKEELGRVVGETTPMQGDWNTGMIELEVTR